MTEPQTTDTLTVRQHKALSALLTEPSVSRAATACEVPERTLRAWLRKPEFDTAYREARRDATQQAIARLQQASGAAVHVLLTVMARENSPAHARIAAASKVLDLAIRAVELEDLEQRIKILEERYAE